MQHDNHDIRAEELSKTQRASALGELIAQRKLLFTWHIFLQSCLSYRQRSPVETRSRQESQVQEPCRLARLLDRLAVI
eukprot:scaffold101_cov230-Pinguiococcus_pyrenoidosus.AAC.11